MQESKQPEQDHAKWNFDSDVMTKEEKLQMEKQGNLKDHYFAFISATTSSKVGFLWDETLDFFFLCSCF